MIAELRRRGLLWPALMTALALPLLLGLGKWQLDRLAWKEGLIAQIEARTKAPPIDIAEAVARLERGEDVEYLRVAARGRFLHDRERFLYAPSATEGPGVNVMTPLALAGGDTAVIFVNRGFVPDALRDPAKRIEGQVAGNVQVVGLLRAPEVPGKFSPDADPAHNLWYWRDLGSMAEAAFPGGTARVVALFLDAEAPAPGGWPRGAATRLDIPNRHLEYALTWFGLAAALVAVFIAYAVPRLGRGTG